MIRVAAVGDVHVGRDSAGCLAPQVAHLAERADVLLLAGDLTKRGLPDEARVLVAELAAVHVPIVAVLGNHDYEADRVDDVVDVLTGGRITVLEGGAARFLVGDQTVGIAGAKGFGGGFPGASGSDFGEPEMKAFMRHGAEAATRLDDGLREIAGDDVRIALMHYAPVEGTLRGERLEIYPFLGSYLLAEAVDRHRVDVALHGHAHGGTERGVTPGGVPVRNVAQPVLRRSYALLCFGTDDGEDCEVVGLDQRAGDAVVATGRRS